MDPSICWLQPEQDGPAKALWLRLWHTYQEFDNLNIANGDSDTEICPANSSPAVSNNAHVDKNAFHRHRPRKAENRASTRNLNLQEHHIMGEYGGCPWRQKNFKYSRGVIGYVLNLTQDHRCLLSFLFLQGFTRKSSISMSGPDPLPSSTPSVERSSSGWSPLF